MKTLLFCMLGLGLTACGSSPKGTNGDQDELAMLIGTYTNGSSKGVSIPSALIRRREQPFRSVQRHCPIPPTSSPRKMANLSMPSVK